jgi:hypothetical protein
LIKKFSENFRKMFVCFGKNHIENFLLDKFLNKVSENLWKMLRKLENKIYYSLEMSENDSLIFFFNELRHFWMIPN